MRRQFVVKRTIRVGLISVAVSDRLLGNVGQAAWEASGALQVQDALPADAFTVTRPLVVQSGKQADVEKILRDWCDAPNKDARCDLILTVGGDGLGPRDIIPDATSTVLARTLSGLSEHLRRLAPVSSAADPTLPASLSRAVAGIRGQTLIINIPSCYAHPADAIRVLLPLLPEALASLGVEAFEEIAPDEAAGA